jgi:CspA family cold shock protein
LPVPPFAALIPDRFKRKCGRGDRYSEVRDKGIWIIQPDSGGKDVFVHISAVERAGLSSLNEGAKVSYEEMENRGKTSAENLRVG